MSRCRSARTVVRGGRRSKDDFSTDGEGTLVRISESQFKAIAKRAAPGKISVERPKPRPSSDGEKPPAKAKGRNRHARVDYAAQIEPIVISIPLPYDPRPKERPRSAINYKALKDAFFQARGSVERFMAIITGGEAQSSPFDGGKKKRAGIITTYTPGRTDEYEKLLKAEGGIVMMRRKVLDVPLEADIVLTLTGDPETWPTSALDGDGDNLQKAVLDALNGVVFTDDRLIVRKSVEKRCGDAPALTITVRGAAP
jgi:Holliday junction resolvase RusA-like endonuclease